MSVTEVFGLAAPVRERAGERTEQKAEWSGGFGNSSREPQRASQVLATGGQWAEQANTRGTGCLLSQPRHGGSHPINNDTARDALRSLVTLLQLQGSAYGSRQAEAIIATTGISLKWLAEIKHHVYQLVGRERNPNRTNQISTDLHHNRKIGCVSNIETKLTILHPKASIAG